MADRPEAPDDVPPEAFDGLGLDSLSDGVHPTRADWAAVQAAAGRHGRRRRATLSVAAAVLLVVVVGGVLLARSGREAVDVATGAGAGAAHWAVPPEAATGVRVAPGDGVASMWFELDGRPYVLHQSAVDVGVTGTTVTDELIEAQLPQVNGTSITDPVLGRAYLTCSSTTTFAGDGTTGVAERSVALGPTAVGWLAGSWSYYLTPADPTDRSTDCGASDPDPSAVVDLARSLRYLDDAAWQRFVAEHPAEAAAPGTGPGTTSTLPEDAPADRGSAEEQVAAAVAAWSTRAADGTFPNLEDGVEKAAEYAEMFDLAARQSGADRDGGADEDATTLTRLRFVTPERASITMEMTATLPSGTFTFGQEGEAILQDGRWVVTYRTVTTTLGRACLPPGGYDGCP